MPTYPKLVRDKIPEIVAQGGRTAETRVLTDPSELLHFLRAKLLEEAAELTEAETEEHQTEEFADVYEVLVALATHLGIAAADITAAQDSKRAERGGFDGGILMYA